MKIELTVEGSEPTTHKLSKSKTIIGSGADCDVVVSADGISRKHLAVLVENDQFFVIDQGSANGTFVNEERLVPGERSEFTSFFPLRLASSVTLALLSDEEGQTTQFDFAASLPKSESSAPKPRPVARSGSSRDVDKTIESFDFGKKTMPAVKESPKTKRISARQEDKQKMTRTIWLALFVLVGGTGAFFYSEREPVDEAKTQSTAVVSAPPPILLSTSSIVLRLPQQSALIVNTSSPKCIDDLGKIYCAALGLPNANEPLSGVRETSDGIVAIFPMQKAKDAVTPLVLKEWSKEAEAQWPQEVDPRVLVILYLAQMSDAGWTSIPANKPWLYIGFVANSDQTGKAYVVDLAAMAVTLSSEIRSGIKDAVRVGSIDLARAYSGMVREL